MQLYSILILVLCFAKDSMGLPAVGEVHGKNDFDEIVSKAHDIAQKARQGAAYRGRSIFSDEPNTTTTHATPSTTPSSGNTTEILLGIFIPLLIIAAGILVFILLRKQKFPEIRFARRVSSRKRKRRLSYHPISITEFNSEYSSRKRNKEIEEEFDLLHDYSNKLYESRSRQIGSEEVNKAKNRFVDIIPYDDTLVQLQKESGTPPSHYINASYIQGSSKDERYIATQGPKRNTVVDFWSMILEQKASVIVCLTNVVEAGRVKCFQYWPNVGEMLHFDELTLFTKDEIASNHGECLIRTIEVSKDDDEPTVITQFHLTSWPDHGVPSSSGPLLHLCQNLMQSGLLRSNSSSIDSPGATVVVHCSAGVGRTGTLLATMFAVQEIAVKKVSEIDITDIVRQLREQRPKMVQTFDQYSFIYVCVRDFIAINSKARNDFKNRDNSNGSILPSSNNKF